MKKALIAPLIATAICLSSTAYAATPGTTYTDVPVDHWAYVAVNELSRAGIIDGYGDKTFQGNKTMTRYEMAQAVEKAMESSSKATAKQKLLIDKLAFEFALEINKLDTRVQKVEKFTQNTLRVGYDTLMTYGTDDPPAGSGMSKPKGNEAFKSRFRLLLSGDLNEKTKFFARVGTSYGYLGMNNATSVPSSNSNINMYGDLAYFTFSNTLGFDAIKLGRGSIGELANNVLNKDADDGITLEKKLSKNTMVRAAYMIPKLNNTAATVYDAQAVQFISVNSKADDDTYGASAVYFNNNMQVSSTGSSVGYNSSKLVGASGYKRFGQWTLLGEYARASLDGASSNAPSSHPHESLIQISTSKKPTMFLNPQTMCDIFKPGDSAFTVAYHFLGAGVTPTGFSSWKNSTNTSPTNTFAANFTDNVKGWSIDYMQTLMKGLAIDFTYMQLKYANTVGGAAIAGNKVDNTFGIAVQGRF